MIISRTPIPSVEILESRTVPSGAAGAFAQVEGMVPAETQRAAVPIRIGADDFTPSRGGGVILIAEAIPGGEGGLDPAAPNLIPGAGGDIFSRIPDIPGSDGAGATVLRLGPGPHALLVGGDGTTSGGFTLLFFLAGDVDGNHQVTNDDLAAIRQSMGGRAGEDGFVAAADVNRDGTISRYDLALARSNLGAATSLTPLSITGAISPASDPDGDGVVHSSPAILAGQTTPGASVRALGKGIRAMANAGGGYQLNVPLSPGPNPIAIQARDRFGQRVATAVAPTLGEKSESLELGTDFREGADGWSAGFAEYNPATDPDGSLYALEGGIAPLPVEVGPGTGFLLQGSNRSDDLFLFAKKKVGPEDGIEPNTDYQVHMKLSYASNAPSGGMGAGGAPGESVYLKAGASGIEPRANADAQGFLHMSIHKGNQAQGGADASVVGNIANGIDASEGTIPYASMTKYHIHEFTARSDAEGNLWLLVGVDSGYEGTTALFLQQVVATLIPVED